MFAQRVLIVGLCVAAALAWLGQDGEDGRAAEAPAPTRPLDAGLALPRMDQAAAIPAAVPVVMARLDELWNQAIVQDSTPGVAEPAWDALRDAARADAELLQKLIDRYDSILAPRQRARLKVLLTDVGGEPVAAFSQRLATSRDPAARKDGFEMLQRLPAELQSPVVRELIRTAWYTEQDPAVLSRALIALKPGAAAPDAQTLDQLRHLTYGQDPAVRANSLMQLAQWDKSPGMEEYVYQAVIDASAEVRRAGVMAALESGSRSARLKDALLTMIQNGGESEEVRGYALDALRFFSLSGYELTLYQEAQRAALAQARPATPACAVDVACGSLR